MSVEPKSDVTTRAEIASLDRIKTSPWLQDHLKPRAGDSVPARAKCCANFIFQRTRSRLLRNQSITIPNIRHLPNIGFAQTHPMMHMSLEGNFPVTQIGKLVAVRIGRAAGPGNAVKVVRPLARRGQWLLFPLIGYGSLGTFAKFILLTTCWPETRLSPGSNFACQKLKSSEPPAHTRRFRGTIDKTRRSRSFGSPAQRQPRMANRHAAQPRPTAKGASQ